MRYIIKYVMRPDLPRKLYRNIIKYIPVHRWPDEK